MPVHVHGMRKAGAVNIENPVAMPKGGMTIFLIETAPEPRERAKPLLRAAATAASSAKSRNRSQPRLTEGPG